MYTLEELMTESIVYRVTSKPGRIKYLKIQNGKGYWIDNSFNNFYNINDIIESVKGDKFLKVGKVHKLLVGLE